MENNHKLAITKHKGKLENSKYEEDKNSYKNSNSSHEEKVPASFSPYENAARHYSMDHSVSNSNSKSSECEDSFKK